MTRGYPHRAHTSDKVADAVVDHDRPTNPYPKDNNKLHEGRPFPCPRMHELRMVHGDAKIVGASPENDRRPRRIVYAIDITCRCAAAISIADPTHTDARLTPLSGVVRLDHNMVTPADLAVSNGAECHRNHRRTATKEIHDGSARRRHARECPARRAVGLGRRECR
jgi:hypothetical protein